jgi:hypothetical protein
VQTDYVYETEAEFEADKDNIPVGATVIKLYEYPDNLAGFMVVPDYANMGTTNLMPVPGATPNASKTIIWTADKTGFIKIDGSIYIVSGGTSWIRAQVYINDNVVGEWLSGDTSSANDRVCINLLAPVSQGDVVRFWSAQNSSNTVFGNSIYAFFIPPKFIKKELPVIVEKNGSYSLDEVQTADTWIDGKPIYKKSVNIANAANMNTGVVDFFVTIPNIEQVVDYSLVVKANASNTFKETTYFNIKILTFGILDNGNLGAYNTTQVQQMMTNTMVCTVWYTKTTD